MKKTCSEKECVNWELYGEKKCPNYVETWWTPSSLIGGEPILVQDCAPKRTLLMIQELYNRFIGVQKSQEEVRNEIAWVSAVGSIIGKGLGMDVEQYVDERKRLEKIREKTLVIEHKEE